MDYGGLYGGHLNLEQRLLSRGAGHRGGHDLVGVGGDLGTLGEVVGVFGD